MSTAEATASTSRKIAPHLPGHVADRTDPAEPIGYCSLHSVDTHFNSRASAAIPAVTYYATAGYKISANPPLHTLAHNTTLVERDSGRLHDYRMPEDAKEGQ